MLNVYFLIRRKKRMNPQTKMMRMMKMKMMTRARVIISFKFSRNDKDLIVTLNMKS